MKVSDDLPHIACVYGLFKDGVLVYVGQTIDLFNRRMQQHPARWSEFADEVRYIPIKDKYTRMRIERWFLSRYRPTRNKIIYRQQYQEKRPELTRVYPGSAVIQ